ncbi:MAG: PleD family two-component system response regulator [Mastigocoleus sp.]
MKTVLVVDDTPSQLELINLYLKDNGYNVIRATNAKEAFEKAIFSPPDVIITDIVMPEMSGFEFCRRLKRNSETHQVPIIICSSKDKEIDKVWGMRQGAQMYLTKPFSKHDLITAVESVIN